MEITDLVGKYAIKGNNQDSEQTPYTGVLELALNSNNKISASWTIGENQTQKGVGFFKDDILVVNFNYQGDDERTFKGVVVYRCINRNIIKGFWSEKYGDQSVLGEENGVRINPFSEN
ncbi:MAG: hypothetical protein GQ574_15005 [Crocinitomix sp.]|nr:hypothetical protein [Crocinitomix sp.]